MKEGGGGHCCAIATTKPTDLGKPGMM